jgi:hypothetical protein
MEHSTLKNVLLAGGGVVIIGALFSLSWIFPSKAPTGTKDAGALPGLQTSAAPWPAEIAHLSERLQLLGLPTLSEEGTALHIHQHIDVLIDGRPVEVPAEIGINQAANFISDIHTHDSTGVIHIESPTVETFTLGQFFDIWGVKFSTDCIGSYCADASHTLKVYVNGSLASGDPRNIQLTPHEEIAVVFGTSSSTSNIPSSYSFEPGL